MQEQQSDKELVLRQNIISSPCSSGGPSYRPNRSDGDDNNNILSEENEDEDVHNTIL